MTHEPDVVSSSTLPVKTPAPSIDESSVLDLPFAEAKELTTKAFEVRYLTAMLERAHGSISAAARLAHLDRSNFRRLLRRHGLRGHALDHEHEHDLEHEHLAPAVTAAVVRASAPRYPGSVSPLAAETRRA
jgi:predicted HTH domain antitoxin